MLDAIGYVLVATLLGGFSVWLGIYILYEVYRRWAYGPSPQERSLDENQQASEEYHDNAA